MEKDPGSRPASVAQLAQALPGGDPMTAAIAAGETPSPEMVAASGSNEGFRPAVAWGLLLFIVVGTLAVIAMGDRIFLHRRMPFEKSTSILVERSHDIVRKLGYPEEPADSAYGFVYNEDLLRDIEKSDKTADRWNNLDAKAILFWYRQSPRPLELSLDGTTGYEDPPSRPPGEVRLVLDMEGHLVSFRAVPPASRSSAAGAVREPDWKVLFDEAGLDMARWTEVDSQTYPSAYVDAMAAWHGTLPNRPGVTIQIEAAALEGNPVNFEITVPRGQNAEPSPGELIAIMARLFFLLALVVGGLFFARRNLRLGRGDRRHAKRLALCMAAAVALRSLLSDRMAIDPAINFIPGIALLVGGLFWIIYMAFEPFVRRKWPRILVSWTRLLSGDWRDPLIARDIVVGCAFGVIATCIFRIGYFLVPLWLGHAEYWRPICGLTALAGPRFFVSHFIYLALNSIVMLLGLVALLFFLKILLRNQIAALVICGVVWGLVQAGMSLNYGTFVLGLLLAALQLFVLMRFGLVAAIISNFYSATIMNGYPLTLDFSAWYRHTGYALLAIFAAIVLYAFYTSLGRRPMFGTPRLDD